MLTGTDDLPVIRDNIKKGFIETQNKAMSFINTLRKQFDGDDEEEERPPPPPPRKGPNQPAYTRRSGDRDRYDADPQVLGDDFTRLQMNDETGEMLLIPTLSFMLIFGFSSTNLYTPTSQS